MEKFDQKEFLNLNLKMKNLLRKLEKIVEIKENLLAELQKSKNKDEIMEKITILDKNFISLYNEIDNIKKQIKSL